jgi:FMN phosphatase YigB (HAD superfamily)
MKLAMRASTSVPGDVSLPIAAVLFDFAGTLFTPLPATELLTSAASGLSIELSADECALLAEEYLEAGLPGGPYPSEVPDQLSSLYAKRDLSPEAHRAAYVGLLSTVAQPYPGLPEAVYDEICAPPGWVPYSDAHEVICCLQTRGLRVGVVSNVGFDLRPILRDHGFEQLAHHCTLSFEMNATKPDPRIFRAALRTLKADATTTLMVGDHPSADGGATAIGMRTLILPMTPPGSRHGLNRVIRLLDQPEA